MWYLYAVNRPTTSARSETHSIVKRELQGFYLILIKLEIFHVHTDAFVIGRSAFKLVLLAQHPGTFVFGVESNLVVKLDSGF